MPFDGAGFIQGERVHKLDAVSRLLGTPNGWCKGTLRTGDGRYCLRGAIMAVHAAGLLEAPILRAINEVTGRHFRRIEAFNDHPHTDHALVCAVLQRAREHLLLGESSGQPVPIGGGGTPRVSTMQRWRDTVRGWFALA
jgi:hypothetical protein